LFSSAQVKSERTDVFFQLASKASPPGVEQSGKRLPLGRRKDIRWFTICQHISSEKTCKTQQDARKIKSLTEVEKK